MLWRMDAQEKVGHKRITEKMDPRGHNVNQ